MCPKPFFQPSKKDFWISARRVDIFALYNSCSDDLNFKESESLNGPFIVLEKMAEMKEMKNDWNILINIHIIGILITSILKR